MSRVLRPWVRNVQPQRTTTTSRLAIADEVRDVDAQPQEPGREAALPPERPEPADVGDPGQPADDRDIAVVAVAERLVRPAEDPPADDLRGVRPALHRALGDARRRLALLPRLDRRVADDEDLRVPGQREVRSDQHAPRPVGLGAGGLGDGPRERRRGDAGRPQHGPRRDRLLAVGGDDPHAGARRCRSRGSRSARSRRAARAGAAPTRSGPAGTAAGPGPSPRPGRSGRPRGGWTGSRA